MSRTNRLGNMSAVDAYIRVYSRWMERVGRCSDRPLHVVCMQLDILAGAERTTLQDGCCLTAVLKCVCTTSILAEDASGFACFLSVHLFVRQFLCGLGSSCGSIPLV